MGHLNFAKEKYLEILKNQGLSAALTALHQDTETMEQMTFEGKDGYQADFFEELKKVREFSRELWNYRY